MTARECSNMRRYAGFTLIEISVALAVMSVLMLGAIPVYRAEQLRAKEKELRLSLIQIRQALDDYKRASDDSRIVKSAGSSGYPANLDALVRGAQKAGTQQREWIYFLRRLPRDPFAPEELSVLSATGTWDTRASSSPPDAPAPGADVFDVFSKSKKIGLNGIPYNKW
jgi:general secretion pathway protein G